MDKSSSNTNIFAKLFFGAIAIWAVPLYQGGKKLLEKSLDGLWGGLLAFFVGLPAAIAGGIYAGNWVGWKQFPAVETWFQSWVPSSLTSISNFLLHYGWGVIGVIAGALAFWVLFAYGWSILYLIGVRPVNAAAKKVRRFFEERARKHYANLETSFLTAVKTVFQPSGLWTAVQEKDKKGTWVKTLFGGVGYISLILGTAYLGWQTLTGIQGLLVGFFGLTGYLALAAYLPGFLVAYFVVFTVGSFLANFMEYAHLGFTAVICGVATAIALLPLTPGILGLTAASTTAATVAGYAGIFAAEALAIVAYVFPALYLLLTGGLMKKIADAVEKLFDTVLDEKKTNFRRLFHELVTFATVYQFTKLSLMLWALLGITGGWSVALAAAVALLTYVLVGGLLEVGREWSIGNGLIGFLGAAHAGGFAGYAWATKGLLFGTWGGIVVGALVFLASFCVAFPIIYRVARGFCDLTRLSYVGVPLGWLHDQTWKGFKAVMKKFEAVYERGYFDDRAQKSNFDFRKLFLQVANLLISAPTGFLVGILVWKALGIIPVLTIPVGLVLAFVAYCLLGKLVLDGGSYFVGVVAAIVGGSGAGVLAFNAVAFETTAQKLYVALPVGILAWFAVFFFVFPAAYIVLRFLTGWSTGFMLPLVEGLYKFCSQIFDKLIWEPFKAVYRFVRDWFWLPIWRGFLRICAWVWGIMVGIWSGIRDAWNGMFGRKSA